MEEKEWWEVGDHTALKGMRTDEEWEEFCKWLKNTEETANA